MRTLITNGTVVTADGSYAADILIDGEVGAGSVLDEVIDRGNRTTYGLAAAGWMYLG